MITPGSAWTLPMCREAAAAITELHGLEVDVYIEGGPVDSVVRFDVRRGAGITCWVALTTAVFEACADEAAVRAVVECEIETLVRTRHGTGAAA